MITLIYIVRYVTSVPNNCTFPRLYVCTYIGCITYMFCFSQLDINTVAAGGGSMLFFRSGMFVVGPESAGANPGPSCYGKGQY